MNQINKTECVLFGTRKFNNNIICTKLTIAGEDNRFVNEYKYLGTELEQTVSFPTHIKYIHSLASHKIYMLSKVRTCIDQPTAIKIYKTKILPYFDQGDILLYDFNKKDVEKLQKLQNRALSICLNANNKQHINNLHNISNVPMLKDRPYYNLSIYAYTRTKLEDYVDICPIITRRRTAPLLKN